MTKEVPNPKKESASLRRRLQVPYRDLEELAQELAKGIVEAHPDVLLWEYDGALGKHVFRDREFAEDAIGEVIKRVVLLKSSKENMT